MNNIKNDIKILQLFLDNKQSEFTINQISKILKLNYRIAHEQTKKLEQEGLIQTKKVGQSLLCSLTGLFNEKIYLAEYMRRNEILKNNDLKLIRKRFGKAKQTYILLLIGSYTKGTKTKHSDIDLLAITPQPEELNEIRDLIPRNIHLTTTSYALFSEMILSKELSIGNETLDNNHILIGIEEYYRLIENVK